MILDLLTNSTRAYASGMFTILAGSTEERILVHEAVLAGSPVFSAMTRLPFKEKEEKTILLPDDKASHVRCLAAFLYTGGFCTQSECNLRRQKDTKIEEIGLSSKSRRTESDHEAFTIALDLEISLSDTIVQTETDRLTHAERAVAEDLAQIFMLGDKYQIPGLRRCALQNLDMWFMPSTRPIHFLHLVIILNIHIPESNAEFRNFVQTNLRKTVNQSVVTKNRIVRSIIKNGFMRQSGILAEEILSTYTHDRS